MQLELDGRDVRVVISKRNLLALLAKVDDPDSYKTIYRQGPPEGHDLWIRVEPDIVHYENREPPGMMHPKAEQFIRDTTVLETARKPKKEYEDGKGKREGGGEQAAQSSEESRAG